MSYGKFFEMLNKADRIKHLWDRDKRELNVDLFERELAVMSPSEVHLAKFFAAVWLGNNERYGFDLVDAAASIDPDASDLIRQWLTDPFWP